MGILACSTAYTISNEYEVVYLKRENEEDVIIGDFYGDPACAVISPDETWCAIGGAGLIVYFLRQPFEPYRYDYPTGQWIEFGRDAEDPWWIDSLQADSATELIFTTDPNGNHPGTFRFNMATGNMDKES